MSFKLVISQALTVAVKGTIQDGASQLPFSFSLLATRLNSEELQALFTRCERRYADMLAEVVTGWKDVLTDDNAQVEFSTQGLRALTNTHGLAQVCWDAYNEACSVKGKAGN